LRVFTIALSGPALAQDLPEVPISSEVAAMMATTVESGDYLQQVSGYALDADRDGDLDLIVEVASSPVGGNAVWVVPYVLRNTGGTYEIATKLDINGWISGLRLDGEVLTITTTTYLPGDARCCPSGIEVRDFALR